MRPSPVITRSALARRSAKPTACRTSNAPETRRASRNARSRSKAAGRAGAGHVAYASTDEALDHVGVARERRVELADHLCRRAFLRSVDRGGALGAKERVAHVARGFDARSDEPQVGLPVDARELSERRAALRQIASLAIEKAVTERARHPRT